MDKAKSVKSSEEGTFLVAQWLGLGLLMQGLQVRSLVEELRSHMLPDRKIKQKQYCIKVNKGLKKIVHIKKIFKKSSGHDGEMAAMLVMSRGSESSYTQSPW